MNTCKSIHTESKFRESHNCSSSYFHSSLESSSISQVTKRIPFLYLSLTFNKKSIHLFCA